jgi:transcriptional regulator with XRE-family HTH domain
MATSPTSHDAPYRHYLREWREYRGWLQVDLAKRVGIAKSAISRYETGDRGIHLEMQFKLMWALGITPAQFFSPPDAPSLDAIVSGGTLEQKRLAVNLVRDIVAGGREE